MKLYTEQQLRNALYILHYSVKEMSEDQIVNDLIPIELPSDEEIEEASNIMLLYPTDKNANFRIGAKWMKEQILNQNK